MGLNRLHVVAACCLVLCLADLGRAEELHLQFKVTEEKIPSSGTTKIAAAPALATTPPVRRQTRTREVTVGLGGDYFFLEGEGERTIYNFKTRRIVTLDLSKSTVRDDSLFWIVGFNDAEIRNWLMLNFILHKASAMEGKDALPSDDAFNLEAIFRLKLSSLDNPQVSEAVKKLAPTQIKSTTKAGGTIFTNAGKMVTRVEYSKHVIPKTYKKTFSRFLLYNCTIHPSIRTQIEDVGKVPSEMFYSVTDAFGQTKSTWTLISASVKKTDSSAVPGTYKPAYDPNDPLDVVLKRSLKQADAPTKNAAIESAEKAMAEGNPLDAFLALMEYGLQTDEKLLGHTRKIVQAGKNDPQFTLFVASQRQVRSKELMEKKVEMMDRIDRTVLSKGYVLDIFKANFITPLGRTGEARELFFGVLGQNPFIAGVYKDLGDLYNQSWDMRGAWRCWDAARRLAPDHALLRGRVQAEKNLMKKYPEYFLEPAAKAPETYPDL